MARLVHLYLPQEERLFQPPEDLLVRPCQPLVHRVLLPEAALLVEPPRLGHPDPVILVVQCLCQQGLVLILVPLLHPRVVTRYLPVALHLEVWPQRLVPVPDHRVLYHMIDHKSHFGRELRSGHHQEQLKISHQRSGLRIYQKDSGRLVVFGELQGLVGWVQWMVQTDNPSKLAVVAVVMADWVVAPGFLVGTVMVDQSQDTHNQNLHTRDLDMT